MAELLVVLTILSVLSVVALQSLQPVADQARYEASRTTLQRVEEAVLGPEGMRQTDGTPILSGFVVDVGRLPLPVAGADPGWELAELWNPALWTAFPYGIRHGPANFNGEDFRAVRLPCGWRGPYLQPATSTDGLRDGWGKPLAYLWIDDTSTAPAQPANLHAALSVEANLVNEMPTVVDSPRTMPLVSLIGSVTYADGAPAVSDSGQNITVDVYLIYPDVANVTNAVDELSVVRFPVTADNPDFVFTSVAPGLRALRAVVRRNSTEVIADKTVYRHVLRKGLSDVRIQLDANAPVADPE